MQSFYFTNEPAKVKNLDTYNSFLNLHPPITKNDFSLNLFYSENCHSFYEENGNFISNLGVFIYKNQWNNKAIRLFFEDFKKSSSLERLLLSEDVHGQYLLMLYFENRFFHFLFFNFDIMFWGSRYFYVTENAKNEGLK